MELLVVIGIIGILLTLAIPAFHAIQGSGDLNKAAHDIAGTLQGARAYAMSDSKSDGALKLVLTP